MNNLLKLQELLECCERLEERQKRLEQVGSVSSILVNESDSDDAKVAPSEGASQGRPGLFQLHHPTVEVGNGADLFFLSGDFMCFFSRLLLK